MKHQSVFLNEVIENLNIKEDGIYLDCTLGYAGHSKEMLKKITRGCLFALEQDQDAIDYSQKKLSKISDKFKIIKTNFKDLKNVLNQEQITEVDGILFDLGVSSPQLDVGERGFSYHQDAYLDMRMDRDIKLTAFQVVNEYPYDKLKYILKTYGEERYASQIAKNIITKRELKKITTTYDLVEIIKSSIPKREHKDKHPARKTFQAIRMEVNQEIDAIKQGIDEAVKVLKKDGILCIITFHSLEDKVCMEVLKKYSQVPKELRNLPYIPEEFKPIIKIIQKLKPSKEEIEANKRARSATLRIIKRC